VRLLSLFIPKAHCPRISIVPAASLDCVAQHSLHYRPMWTLSMKSKLNSSRPLCDQGLSGRDISIMRSNRTGPRDLSARGQNGSIAESGSRALLPYPGRRVLTLRGSETGGKIKRGLASKHGIFFRLTVWDRKLVITHRGDDDEVVSDGSRQPCSTSRRNAPVASEITRHFTVLISGGDRI